MRKTNRKTLITICICFAMFMTGTFSLLKTNAAETISNQLLGDISANGIVDLADAQLALKTALKIIRLDENIITIADVDKDSQVTLSDAQLILKKALKIIDKFPGEADNDIVDNPSESNTPAIIPSESTNPTMAPSDIPQTTPDSSESSEPDIIPSEWPSDTPSESNEPEVTPSEVPSEVPTESKLPDIQSNCRKLQEHLQEGSIVQTIEDNEDNVLMVTYDEENDCFQIIHTYNLLEDGELEEGYIVNLILASDGKGMAQGEYIYVSKSSGESGVTYTEFLPEEYAESVREYYDTTAVVIPESELEIAADMHLDETIRLLDAVLQKKYDISLIDIGFVI